jgi:8-oxo-dGTP diphosphatase
LQLSIFDSCEIIRQEKQVGKKMNQSDEHREAVQVSVDVVLLTLVEQQLLPSCCVVRLRLLRVWALPGGFIHAEEDAAPGQCGARAQKVGIEGAYLEQLATFSGPARDPRGWSVAIAYCARCPCRTCPPIAPTSAWCRSRPLPQLPFDHRAILDAALERVPAKACIPPCLCICAAKHSRCAAAAGL